ncbi:MAG: hypothetical protein QXU18_03435 [Thermoplasmatales archaeon]
MKAYELTLLSPLYYRSRIESGAAGATITAPWIGDLATMYAINNTLHFSNIKFGYTSHKPNYREIMDLGFFLSVLEPVNECRFTKVFDIATSFISEGYPLGKAISDSGRAPMRNWIRRQGLEPGNTFSFLAFFNRNLETFPSKFTIRLGNTKEALALVREIPISMIEKVTLNLYTLSLALGREGINDVIKRIKARQPAGTIEQASSQYVLMRGISVEDLKGILDQYN